MTTQALTRGENTSLASTVDRVRVVVGWSDDSVDVDASALLLCGGKVRGDDDFVFYNQPVSTDGAVQHLGRTASESGAEECLSLDLEDLGEDVEAVAITASLSEGTFGDLDGLRLVVLDETGAPLLTYDIGEATTETAFVFGEVYRRAGTWKIRAVGQGWDSGLAGLATDFGVSVHDDPETPPVAPSAATASDDLVEVLETSAPESLQPAPISPALPPTETAPDPGGTPAVPDAPTPSRRNGVRTTKQRAVVAAPVPKLAGAETWVPARLFSIYGVGGADEQEKRATSALLSTMMGVRPFARAVNAHFGAPAGSVETFLEVPFTHGEHRVIPDGVIRIARGAKVWTALLEVKTGTGQLHKEQVEQYLDVARTEGYDAVITLSNEIAPGTGEHPVTVSSNKLKSVALFHLSWAEVLHEARMVLTHRGAGDAMQAWVLHELIRYLEHPRSGATGFDDMGSSWVAVRESVAAGTLRAGDRKVPTVANSWIRLVRQLCLRLTAELGVPVTHVMPRKLAADPVERAHAAVEQLAALGTMSATLKVPGAAGPITVVADLRTSKVRVSASVPAPQEGGAQRRISWLLRQLKDAPDETLVDVHYSGTIEDTCERLADVRESPAPLVADRSGDVTSFELTMVTPLGTKRSGLKGAFIPSVIGATEAFYTTVLQPLRGWVPPAPKLSEPVAAAPSEDEGDE
ncbi:TerD family protein [Sanguibacter antarcticus]|nr:TerD family protein [Sanguibacter antarcticus]